jgi:tRNA G26 N,N-dimethylase Trm1
MKKLKRILKAISVLLFPTYYQTHRYTTHTERLESDTKNDNTRDDTEDTYYCRNCGTEISRERYEDYDQLCESCEDDKEDSEGDGLMSEGDIMFPGEE